MRSAAQRNVTANAAQMFLIHQVVSILFISLTNPPGNFVGNNGAADMTTMRESSEVEMRNVRIVGTELWNVWNVTKSSKHLLRYKQLLCLL